MSSVQRITPVVRTATPPASPSPSALTSAPRPSDRVEKYDPGPALLTAAVITAAQLVPGVAEVEAAGGLGAGIGMAARLGGKAVAEHIVPVAAFAARKALGGLEAVVTGYLSERVAKAISHDPSIPQPARAAAHAADTAFESLLDLGFR